MSDALIDALGARAGIVCAVGAGGKKSTLYRVLDTHPGRVGLTATAMTTPPPSRYLDTRLFDDAAALVQTVPRAAATHRRVGFACPSEKSGRCAGLPPTRVAEIHEAAGFEVTLVKADGARMRGIKAPRSDEPLIVPGTRTVIFVVSAAVIGQPLNERIAHRVPELTQLLGLTPGDTVSAEHVGHLLSDPAGAAQHIGQATLIGLINQVDGDAQRTLARQAARQAMAGARPPARVVLSAMTASEPLVDVVESARNAAD